MPFEISYLHQWLLKIALSSQFFTQFFSDAGLLLFADSCPPCSRSPASCIPAVPGLNASRRRLPPGPLSCSFFSDEGLLLFARLCSRVLGVSNSNPGAAEAAAAAAARLKCYAARETGVILN